VLTVVFVSLVKILINSLFGSCYGTVIAIVNDRLINIFIPNTKSSRAKSLELFIMVPRDRIELPTRGFSGQIRPNFKTNDFRILSYLIGILYAQKVGKR
jgi:hypothetical protein